MQTATVRTSIARKVFMLQKKSYFNYILDLIHNVIQKTAKLCVSSVKHRRVEKTHGVVYDFASSVAFRSLTANPTEVCKVRIAACVFKTQLCSHECA